MITTPRLILRRARIEDAPNLHRVFADPRAMRYWDSLPHEDPGVTRAWVARMAASGPPDSDDFVIERAGRVIGKAGCWRPPEFGFILHSDHWGQGFGTEALAAAIPHAFATLPIDRLEADVDPRNAASLALLAKFGFRETRRASRTILVGDEWCDSVYLALSRAEFAGPPAP
jgi:ribosomal-protein-alanine N-acetyltransferase